MSTTNNTSISLSPAVTSIDTSFGLTRLPSQVFQMVGVWIERVKVRREIMELDDRMLRDMGATRADADLEGNKPFWNA